MKAGRSPIGANSRGSNVNGSLKVFAVTPDGTVTPSHSVPLPLANAVSSIKGLPETKKRQAETGDGGLHEMAKGVAKNLAPANPVS